MKTINEKVLIRIIETSRNREFIGVNFRPKDCRSYCKNYFEHIVVSYNALLDRIFSGLLAEGWKLAIENKLVKDGILNSTENVLQMLELTRDLLEDNANTKFFWKGGFPK